jgi:Ca2+:H+ antiporter
MLAAPIALGLAGAGAGDLWIFFASAIAIVPLAAVMGRATEQLANALGPGIGGLLNATFGNAAELIMGLLIIMRGPTMYPLVKASITGSIIGNVLLILGMSMLFGGLRRQRQRFNRTAAATGATLLALASIGLIMPSAYVYLFHASGGASSSALGRVESLSEEIAAILIAVYLLYLVFSLRTHRQLYGSDAGGERERPAAAPPWTRRAALLYLLIATAAVAVMAELLVRTVAHAGAALGLNQVFLGVVVLATIGNAAEHSTAVLMAYKDRMELTVQITIGSSLQIALFVAPMLVFASLALGQVPLDLHFTALELLAVLIAAGVLTLVAQDGETNWLEGVLLIAVYAIIALGFYHLPLAAVPTPP